MSTAIEAQRAEQEHRALERMAIARGNSYDVMRHSARGITWARPCHTPFYGSDQRGFRAWGPI